MGTNIKEKTEMYLLTNKHFLPDNGIDTIEKRMLNMEERQFLSLKRVRFNDPTYMFVISLVLGMYGIDRFMRGKILTGLIKLFTGGVFGILYLYDLLTIVRKTRRENYNKLLHIVYLYEKNN